VLPHLCGGQTRKRAGVDSSCIIPIPMTRGKIAIDEDLKCCAHGSILAAIMMGIWLHHGRPGLPAGAASAMRVALSLAMGQPIASDDQLEPACR
jgi:hypothetical protein